MDLNRATIEIRPRPAYEGLDLGCIMAATWFLKLWGLYLLTALPVSALAFLGLYKAPVWAGILVWWLKPLFETPLLFWVSRKVFDEAPEIRLMMKKLITIVKPQLFWRLTLRRLSPSRSFFMPVMLLENMKGRDYVNRTDILGRNQSAGFMLTGTCFLFELVLYFSALALLQWLIPQTIEFSVFDAFFQDEGIAAQMISNLLGILAMSVVAPFYVCAGFALYLSRRTALEAWDIEMNFRRLIKRKAARKKENPSGVKGAAILLACSMVLLSGPVDLSASQADRSQAKERIEGVLADKDFGREEKVTYWRLKDMFSDGDKERFEFPAFFEDLVAFISMVIKPLIWAVCGILAVFLAYYLARSAGAGQRLPEIKRAPPQELFGLKISGESLPADLLAEIRKKLDAGEFRAALSLLYRGTLYRLVFEALIDIPKSATEGECIRLVERHTDPSTARFFTSLTRVWLKQAYGHIQPDRETIDSLCAGWQGLYGKQQG